MVGKGGRESNKNKIDRLVVLAFLVMTLQCNALGTQQQQSKQVGTLQEER